MWEINKLGFLTDRMRGSQFIVIFKCLEDRVSFFEDADLIGVRTQ